MITVETIQQVAHQGPFFPNWQSLGAFVLPEWFRKAKFGVFIHWGLYSVPAFHNEWYSRNMYIKGHPEYDHHIETYGPQKNFGYKDFIPMFTADKFDANEWIRLIKQAGANYLFPVAEHHDGFQMYKSELSEWNASVMGPKKDILGELKEAAEEQGLHFCTSSHRAEHWFFMGHGKDFDSDIKEPLAKGDFYWPAMPEPDHESLFSEPYPSKEFLDDWLLRTCELVDNYQPELLYFDWWIQ
ncbi:alpha-L-fucosidase, partial [uncultured Enterococcus sp.]